MQTALAFGLGCSMPWGETQFREASRAAAQERSRVPSPSPTTACLLRVSHGVHLLKGFDQKMAPIMNQRGDSGL